MTFELKGWMVVSDNQKLLDTFATTRKDSIKRFMDGLSLNWHHWSEKYGYRCIKVNLVATEQ